MKEFQTLTKRIIELQILLPLITPFVHYKSGHVSQDVNWGTLSTLFDAQDNYDCRSMYIESI